MSAETIEVLDGNGYPIRNFLAGIREEMCGFLQREAPREAGVLAAMVLGIKACWKTSTGVPIRWAG